jgi:hypothetical protein
MRRANGNKTTETVAFDLSKEMSEPARYGELIHYPILSLLRRHSGLA